MHVNSFMSYYMHLRFNRRETVDYRIMVLVNSDFTLAYLYCFVVR